MVNMDKAIEQAIEKDASDIHLMSSLKPMYRIARALVEMEGSAVLKDEDMYEIYDYIIKGNIDKDHVFTTTKKLDTSYLMAISALGLLIILSYLSGYIFFNSSLIAIISVVCTLVLDSINKEKIKNNKKYKKTQIITSLILFK